MSDPGKPVQRLAPRTGSVLWYGDCDDSSSLLQGGLGMAGDESLRRPTAATDRRPGAVRADELAITSGMA